MIFPWIISLRPWVIPSDAREQLTFLRESMPEDKFLEHVWTGWNDGIGEGLGLKASPEGWPKGKVADQTNVSTIPVKKSARDRG